MSKYSTAPAKICCFILGLSFLFSETKAQGNFGFKASGYYLFRGGASVSASIGYWKTYKWFQPSTNISGNFLFGSKHLGNNNRRGTGFQFNAVLSPMITANLFTPKKHGVYEEINPMYFSNSSAIYSNYLSSFTLGTSFIVLPKGYGSNYTTSRNRSQQLAFFQAKIGFDTKHNNNGTDATIQKFKDDISFQFNLVEDVSPVALADKWDRFYTGGGSVQLRFAEYYKLKVYSEVYTGTTTRDLMDFPDLVDADTTKRFNPNNKNFLGISLGPARPARYAAQEGGQKAFNNGRTVYCLEIDNNAFRGKNSVDFSKLNVTHDFYVYWQGGDAMWSQNAIHAWNTPGIEKIVEKEVGRSPNDLNLKTFKKGLMKNKDLERLHRFEPVYKYQKRFRTPNLGYGLKYLTH